MISKTDNKLFEMKASQSLTNFSWKYLGSRALNNNNLHVQHSHKKVGDFKSRQLSYKEMRRNSLSGKKGWEFKEIGLNSREVKDKDIIKEWRVFRAR